MAVVGTLEVGGFGEVVRRIQEGERDTFFDFNPDPRIRNTFWTLAIGGMLMGIPRFICIASVYYKREITQLKLILENNHILS